VEERLDAEMDIPVFHDDQHGTAIVCLAALENALKIVGKKEGDLKVVVAGVGAAGVAVSKILMNAGVQNIIGADRQGAVHTGRSDLNKSKRWFAENTNPDELSGSLAEIMPGADVFIGLSGPNLITRDDVIGMAKDPVVFAMANPDPEIRPELIQDVAAVIATGRSDFPNQINNVLAFPGIFRGALDAGARRITENMKVAAARAIAATVLPDELAPHFIIPSVFNPAVATSVARASADAAVADGVCR
jgi:malate dehydrogenase (oxaloacetate-decarboxylating)